MKIKSGKIWVALAALLGIGMTASVQAQITVANSSDIGYTGEFSNSVQVVSDSFDVDGGSAVVLILTTEGADTATALFDGVPMTKGAEAAEGAQKSFIFYLFSPSSSSGSFQINMSGGSSLYPYAYSLLSLNNAYSVATNATVTSTSSSNDVPLELSYTLTNDNNFVVTGAVNNDYDGSKVLTLASGNADTELMGHNVVGSSGHMHCYGDIPSSGSYTDGYYGQFQRTAIASVIFNTESSGAADTDGDGILDVDEISGDANVLYSNEPTDPNDSDSDDDGLSDGIEILSSLTNPNVSDTDGDGLTDEEEVNTYPTDPVNPDSDGDGLTDGEEINIYSTDPLVIDSDGDGWSDGAEVALGTDPNDDNDFPEPADAITVANSSSEHTGSAESGAVVTSSEFDMDGGSAVVLVLTTEGAASANALFADIPMKLAGSAAQGSQTSWIYYLITPSTSVGEFDIIMTSEGSIVYAYSMLSLNDVYSVATNAATNSTSTANTTPLELSYTVTTTNNFVVTGAVNNDYDNNRVLSLAYGNADEVLQAHVLSGTSGHFHCYGDVYLPGTYTDGYYGQYQRTAIASVIFSAEGTPVIDTDGDGIEDASEIAGTENVLYGNEPTDPNDSDSDDDGLSDGQEILGYSTNPNVADTDSDGLSDGYEVNTSATDPLVADSDDDGLSDGEEVNIHMTDPNDVDSDDDKWTDLEEVRLGSDPNDDGDIPTLPADAIDVVESNTFVGGTMVADSETGVLFTTDEFDLAGGSAAILILTAESSSGDWPEPTATFAGQPMEAHVAQYQAQQSTIFYLISPSNTVGEFEVTVETNASGVVTYSMLSLSNVLSVETNNVIESNSNDNGSPANITYTTVSSNCFVVAGAINNDYNNTRLLSVAYGNPDMDLLPHTVVEDNCGVFHTMGHVLFPKTYTDGYLGRYQRTAIASIVFSPSEPVPVDQPVITSIMVDGSDVYLTWTAGNVGTYTIQRKTSLTGGSWVDVVTGLPAGGGSTNVTAGGTDQEYYQIMGQ